LTILILGYHTSGVIHPDRERYISLSEARRISSFPDDYWFSSRTKGIERMGNCVPPAFMAAVADWIKKTILAKINPEMDKYVLQTAPF